MEWEEHQQCMWTLLDVDPDLIVTLVELQIRFADGQLLVSSACQGRTDVVTTVVDTLGALWRFRKWTESRWLTVGASARVFIAGVLTGAGNLVQEICDRGRGDWYVKGFLAIKEEHMNFLVQAALSCRVAESLQQELMHDSRVTLRMAELVGVISEEMRWVTLLAP